MHKLAQNLPENNDSAASGPQNMSLSGNKRWFKAR